MAAPGSIGGPPGDTPPAVPLWWEEYYPPAGAMPVAPMPVPILQPDIPAPLPFAGPPGAMLAPPSGPVPQEPSPWALPPVQAGADVLLPAEFQAPPSPIPWDGPDAVSGGIAPTPPEPEPVRDADAGGDPGWQREARRLAAMPDQERLLLQQERELELQRVENARLKEEAVTRHKQADREFEQFTAQRSAYQRQLDAINSDAITLSQQKADPDRWFKTRTTPQRLAGYISAAIGGMLQVARGIPNSALDMMQREMDRDFAAQQSDLARAGQTLSMRQGVIAQQMSEHGDVFRATQAARIASWQQVIDQIHGDMQNYDPGGSAAFRGAELIRGAQAAQAQAQAEADKVAWDRSKDIVASQQVDEKNALDRDKFGLDVTKYKSEERRKQIAAAGAGRRRAEADREKWITRFYQNDKTIDYAKYPTADAWIKAGAPARGAPAGGDKSPTELSYEASRAVKEEAQASLAKREASAGPGGSPFAVGDPTGQPYLKKDGSILEIKNDTQRDRVHKLNASAQNVRRIADLVAIMRDDSGGASSSVGSKEYQELQSLAAQIDFETFVGYGLGAPSEGDKELAQAVRGGKDITSFLYDTEAGFQSYAAGIEDKFNTEMRTAGYDGPKIEMPRMHKARALERSKEELGASISEPIPPHVTEPEKRSKFIEKAQADVDVLLRRKKPSAEELQGWARKIDEQVEAGSLSKDEAIQIVAPMASKIAKAEQRRIQDMPLAELKKAQTDRAFTRRAFLLNMGDDLRPEEVYELVVGGK